MFYCAIEDEFVFRYGAEDGHVALIWFFNIGLSHQQIIAVSNNVF